MTRTWAERLRDQIRLGLEVDDDRADFWIEVVRKAKEKALGVAELKKTPEFAEPLAPPNPKLPCYKP